MARLYWRVKKKSTGKWTWVKATWKWTKDGCLITSETNQQDLGGDYE